MGESGFYNSETLPVEDLGGGLKRQMLGYDSNLMMVKVLFEKGAVGKEHNHPHRQVTYVDSGVFEVNLGGNIQALGKGDSFFASPDENHGVVCLEPGALIDVFSPAREDFLKE